MTDDRGRGLGERLRTVRLPPARPHLRRVVTDTPAVRRARWTPRLIPLFLLAATLTVGWAMILRELGGATAASAPDSPSLLALAGGSPTAGAEPSAGGSPPASEASPSTDSPIEVSASPTSVAPGSVGAPDASLPTRPTPAPTLTYDGTLSIVATFGAPFWSQDWLTYPVHLAVTPHGAGLGHAYSWGGNLGGQGTDPNNNSGKVLTGQPLSTDLLAHYSCDRAAYGGSPSPGPSAVVADSAAWFVELWGYGVHDVHTLDIEADCAVIGHPMAAPTPVPTPAPTLGWIPTAAPLPSLTLAPPTVRVTALATGTPAGGGAPITSTTPIDLSVSAGGGSPISRIDVTLTPSGGAPATGLTCGCSNSVWRVGPFPEGTLSVVATATDSLGKTGSTSIVITILPPAASPPPSAPASP